MSATATSPSLVELEPRPSGSLLRSEIRRFTHRRFIRWLVLLAAVAYVGIMAIAWTQYTKTTPEELAKAQQQMEELVAQQNLFREDCLRQVPAGEDPDNFCGPPAQASDFGDPESFLPHPPFELADQLPAFSLGMSVLAAALCFLIGATWVGAEWSQKSLMALLFWDPRRLRVFATKVTVLVGAAVGLTAVSQLSLIPITKVMASAKGSSTVPAGFWGDLFAQQARCVLAVCLVALIGFGVANLVRNTGAALGVGFVYFVLEILAMNVRPSLQPWFLTINAAALISKGGITVTWWTGQPSIGPDGSLSDYREMLLTNLHGGLVLGGVALTLVVVGGWLFKRRDLT